MARVFALTTCVAAAWHATPRVPARPAIAVRTTAIRMADGAPGGEEDLARAAGAAAASTAAASSTRDQTAKEERGRTLSATLPAKPFGLVLVQNPSGRGAFVSEIAPDGVAARSNLEVGDFVTSVVGYGIRGVSCAWSELDDVLAAIEAAPLPVKLSVQRGGPEPWTLEKDGSGLSVDQMMRAANAQYGRLLDADKEEALRSAFAEIKEKERAAASDAASAGGFESTSLKAASRLQFELRSFAQGARDALGQLGQLVYNRALLDSKLAASTAEYLLRRTLLDTCVCACACACACAGLDRVGSTSSGAPCSTRATHDGRTDGRHVHGTHTHTHTHTVSRGLLLTASSNAIAALSGVASSAALPPAAGRAAAAPFEKMLGSLSSTRALSAGGANGALEQQKQLSLASATQAEVSEAMRPLSYLLPPTSHLLPPTSHLLPPTSHLLPPTSLPPYLSTSHLLPAHLR